MALMVQFGAGSIGRGLIAPFFNENGYEIFFVDVNQQLVDQLNESKRYEVSYQGTAEKKKVDHFSAINSVDNQGVVNQAIADADFVSISVGVTVLESIADTLAEAVRFMKNNEFKKELTIIAFENLNRASSKVKKMMNEQLTTIERDYLNQYITFYDSAIDGVIPDIADGGLNLVSEAYHEIVIEADQAFDLENVQVVENLDPFIFRKLFIVNMGHATLAWYGYHHRYKDVVDVTKDSGAVELFEMATKESLSVLLDMFPEQKAVLEQYRIDIQERFINQPLSDDVHRIGRNPRIKLHKDERFLKPARLYVGIHNKLPSYLLTAVCLGFNYLIDTESIELDTETELRKLIVEVTELDVNSKIVDNLVKKYKEIMG